MKRSRQLALGLLVVGLIASGVVWGRGIPIHGSGMGMRSGNQTGNAGGSAQGGVSRGGSLQPGRSAAPIGGSHGSHISGVHGSGSGFNPPQHSHHHHGKGTGTVVVISGWGWYGGFPYYAYPYPYYSSPPMVYGGSPAYGDESEAEAYWYYCSDPPGYYPAIETCPAGWQLVPATPQQ